MTTIRSPRAPSRRAVLAATSAGIAAFAAPSVVRADRRLAVGTFGGAFEYAFRQSIYPAFSQDTGIAIDSVPEPTGVAWLVQLERAARSGEAPADVSLMANLSRIGGSNTGLWARLEESRLSHIGNLTDSFVYRYPDGKPYGVAAMSWYVTLVTNVDVYRKAPRSWKAFWDEDNAGKLGLLALPSNSFLLDIAAHTWFDGRETMASDSGIEVALDKVAELRDQVSAWYRDEAQFQEALRTGAVPMGQYYHDVVARAGKEGTTIRSTFPEEGGVIDTGAWTVSRASDRLAEAEVFIDYMSQASVQAAITRAVGTAPVMDWRSTDLTQQEVARVTSDIPPIVPAYELYVERGEWIRRMWSKLVTPT